MNKEEKEKLDELVTALHEKLTPEEFCGLMNSLLDMSEEQFESLVELAESIDKAQQS